MQILSSLASSTELHTWACLHQGCVFVLYIHVVSGQGELQCQATVQPLVSIRVTGRDSHLHSINASMTETHRP